MTVRHALISALPTKQDVNDMRRFRYRSPVVLGRWFATREEALADALRAGQAYRDPDDETQVKLRDDTIIEENDQPLPVTR